MSRITTVYQGLVHHIGGRTGDPARSGKSNKSIDLARRHTKRCCTVPPDKRDFPG